MTPARTLKTVFIEYHPCHFREIRPTSYIAANYTPEHRVKIGRTIIVAFPRYADVRFDAIAARHDLDTWRTKRVEPGSVV
jgi:hypothetical protein